ncbi:MAG: N-acetylglucosamine-6-phosphate deacetylase [Dehalococcoidia bacterium]
MTDRLLLRGARVVTPDTRLENADVLIEDGHIADVRPGIQADGARTTDLPGLFLSPGFIDLHVHGGGGFSLITTDSADIAAYRSWAPTGGTTSFLATICATDIVAASKCLRAIVASGGSDGANLLGANLEGPFVSSERRGALPPSWPATPDTAAFEHLLDAAGGTLRLMTVAPELDGAAKLIAKAIGEGVRISVGHTDATFDEACEGFRAGATQVTHAFNAMRPFHHRDPGPIGAALEADGVVIEVIADGVHLHPATVRTLVQAFGPERVALITDGVTPAGLGAGSFRIGDHEATLKGGEMRLPDGTIAGGVATMIDVVRNVVQWGIADIATAATMASATPAQALDLDRKGLIAPGYDADLVALTEDLTVSRTWVGGREVYAA